MKNKEDLIKKITNFSKLENNWDGNNAPKISQKVINDALDFLNIFPDDLILPEPDVSADDEIILTWESEKGVLDISFYGNDEYIFYYHLFKESSFIGDVCKITEFPEFLKNHIESITKYEN